MAKSHFTRIVAVLFLVVSFNANAGLFAEAGISFYERPFGSLWQQDFAGYWTSWDTRPAMFRVGVDVKGFRFSYFDLGEYGISAEAADDEAGVERCKCVVGGPTRKYYTTGEIRGYALSYKLDLDVIRLKGFYVEGGPIYVRYSLKIEKDDGWRFNEALWGYGHIIGVGYEYKNFTFGFYGYRTKIGGQFEKGATPSGTGGANVLAVGYKF